MPLGARLRSLPVESGWLALILIAGLVVLLAPERWESFAYVALGVGFGGLLARWLPPRRAEASRAPVTRPFVYQAAPPPWESSTSL